MKAALNLPNGISVARILGAPVFAWLLLVADEPYASAWLLGALGATDWLDGWLARRTNKVSDLGKVLDPVADRVLIVVAALAVLAHGSFPRWLAGLILFRELLVSAGVLLLGALGAPRIDVLWVGKTGTLALMVAVPLFLVAAAEVSWSDTARPIAWFMAVVGLAFGWVAAAGYVPLAVRALRARRGQSENAPLG